MLSHFLLIFDLSKCFKLQGHSPLHTHFWAEPTKVRPRGLLGIPAYGGFGYGHKKRLIPVWGKKPIEQ